MAIIEKAELLKRFGAALSEESAALFIGAGLSVASGFVNWQELLREVASELGLDVTRETDLVSLAQFHVNTRQGRARINEILVEEFTKDAKSTENHRLIASLPLKTIWTTNYDDLIEQAFRDAKKKPDVKTTVANLAQTKKDRDVVVYKMHGDKEQPQSAILIREDYENYSESHAAFSIALQGDLVEKTFLFLGFSFTDPNIDYILTRVGILLGKSQRDHFCVIRRPSIAANASPEDIAEHRYNWRRLELRIADLSRYRIHTVVIDSFSEITSLLADLNRRVHLRDVFVSGSSADASPLGEKRLNSLCVSLGEALITNGLNLVSGFGLGIGTDVAYGALKRIHLDQLDPGRVRIMPFPQIALDEARQTLYTKHRELLIFLAGFSVFISGNRRTEDGSTENAPGVLEEFAITVKLGKVPIPIGATGGMAEQIWKEISMEPSKFFGAADVQKPLSDLMDPSLSNEDYMAAVFEIIRRCSK